MAKQTKRVGGRRTWLAEIVDPEGHDPKAGRNKVSRRVRAAMKRFQKIAKVRRIVRQTGETPRKLEQMRRLDWVTEKIRLGWSTRKISYQFAVTFNMSKESAAKYIERVYKDFQNQFSDASKRTVLMAEHCACLKEAASLALAAGEFDAANVLLRQYAEVVGILVPASMIKFHSEDNRQQLIVHNADEMKATLSALENLSERDLFSQAYAASHSQGDDQQGPKVLPLLDAETAVSVPDREKARVVRGAVSH